MSYSYLVSNFEYHELFILQKPYSEFHAFAIFEDKMMTPVTMYFGHNHFCSPTQNNSSYPIQASVVNTLSLQI